MFRSFGLFPYNDLTYLVFLFVYYERAQWMMFQKRVLSTKLNIYVFNILVKETIVRRYKNSLKKMDNQKS